MILLPLAMDPAARGPGDSQLRCQRGILSETLYYTLRLLNNSVGS